MDVDSDNTNNSKENTNNSSASDCKETDLRYDVELTRAIKENHGAPIIDARLCPFEGGEAYFVTVGSNQVNVYDCCVRGNFISTLLNYRNWHLQTMRCKNVVWKENLEREHPKELEKKSFNSVCWMKRYADFYIAAADNEQQIHLLSLTNAQCVKLIATERNIYELLAHPMYPNILCAIDCDHKLSFIDITNDETIYVCADKVCKIAFSPSGNKFAAVLTNGNVREYTQTVEMMDDDMKDNMDESEEEQDFDIDIHDKNKNKNKNVNVNVNNNRNNNNNIKKRVRNNKKLMVNKLNMYKMENTGKDVNDMHYYGENVVIIGNESAEFKMVNMGNTQLLHQWKVSAPIEKGSVCTFDVNTKSGLMVYGNAAHQVQIFDLKKKKYLRKIDTGRGRKLPFSFATFCKHHKQSVMMICENVVMKFDPLELVKEYFPSTADFTQQTRDGINMFNTVKVIQYEADKIKN